MERETRSIKSKDKGCGRGMKNEEKDMETEGGGI
jgi:hypothetical protein